MLLFILEKNYFEINKKYSSNTQTLTDAENKWRVLRTSTIYSLLFVLVRTLAVLFDSLLVSSIEFSFIYITLLTVETVTKWLYRKSGYKILI